MSHADSHTQPQLLQRLVDLITTETSSTSSSDGSVSTSSLSLIFASLTSSVLAELDAGTLPAPALSALQSQLRCIPTSTYTQLSDVIGAVSALPSSSLDTPPWVFLGQHAITARPLVAVLSMQLGHAGAHALVVAALYFALLSLPQPPLYLWNEGLMRKALACMGKWAAKAQLGRDEAAVKGKKGEKRTQEDEEDDGAVDDATDEPLAGCDSTSVDDEQPICRALQALLSALTSFPLQPYADVKPVLMDALIALTRTQKAAAAEESPSSLAWSALSAMCSPLHGESASPWSALLKALLPNSLMAFAHSPSPLPPPHLLIVAQSTTDFLIASPHPSTLLAYFQHVSLSTPDRSDYRRVVARSTVDVLLAHPVLLAPFARFLVRLSRNAKAGVRITAIELAAGVLKRVGSGQEEVMNLTVGVLMGRCSDKAPGVRTRALVEVGKCLEEGDKSEEVRAAIIALLDDADDVEGAPATGGRESLVMATPSARQSHSSLTTPLELYTPATAASSLSSAEPLTPFTPSAVPSIGLQSLLHLLHRRCADPKPTVRRASLATLTVLLLLHRTSPAFPPSISVSSLQSLYDSCQDQSVLVRKQAMASLTALATAYESDAVVGQVWLGGVLPLLEDAETSVRDRAIDCVREMVVDRAERAMSEGEEGRGVWTLLAALDDGMGRLLQLAVARLLQHDAFPAALLRSLNAAMATSAVPGVWLLLEAVSRQKPAAVDVDGLLAAWRRAESSETMDDGLMVRLLSVVTHLSALFPPEDAQWSALRLHERVNDVRKPMTAALVKAHIAALTALSSAQSAAQGMAWEEQLLAACERVLETFVLRGQGDAQSQREDTVVRCLFTIGEIILVRALYPVHCAVSALRRCLTSVLSVCHVDV